MMLPEIREQYITEGKHNIMVTPALGVFECHVHEIKAGLPSDYNPKRPNWERLNKFCDFAQTVEHVG